MIDLILSLFLFTNTAPQTNYDLILEGLKKISQENPNTTQWVEIGVSDTGLPIVGLKIGTGETADMIVGTHHGNEYGSTAVAMGAADAFARDPLPGHTIYVVPVLNISGYNARIRHERVNSGSSIDPNRDYPGPCVNYATHRSKATRALAQFIDDKKVVNSATLHTYWPAVVYPWGLSTKDISTPHDAEFIALTKAAVVESGYSVGNSKELLYAADGTYEDYAFWKHGVWSLLFEMGNTHSPSQAAMKKMIEVNVPGIRRFFDMAPKARATNHAFTGKCDFNVMQRPVLE